MALEEMDRSLVDAGHEPSKPVNRFPMKVSYAQLFLRGQPVGERKAAYMGEDMRVRDLVWTAGLDGLEFDAISVASLVGAVVDTKRFPVKLEPGETFTLSLTR